MPDEGHHIADDARTRDLARETEYGTILGIAPPVLADVAHDDEMGGRRHQAKLALTCAQSLARRSAYGMRRARCVNAHELKPLIVHRPSPIRCRL